VERTTVRSGLPTPRGRGDGEPPGGAERTCRSAIVGAEGGGWAPEAMWVDWRTAVVLLTLRVIQRRAYGLRDQEYLRLKVLTCMLPPI
jgi:hypothetical protein